MDRDVTQAVDVGWLQKFQSRNEISVCCLWGIIDCSYVPDHHIPMHTYPHSFSRVAMRLYGTFVDTCALRKSASTCMKVMNVQALGSNIHVQQQPFTF